jgi:hypothetical protein
VSGHEVELVIAPDRVERADPERLHVSFPSRATTDAGNIRASFCGYVHFLAGDDAARAWQDAHPEGEVRDLQAAFALGCDVVEPLVAAAGSSTG